MIFDMGQSLRLRPVRRRNTCSSVGRSIWNASTGVSAAMRFSSASGSGTCTPALGAAGLHHQGGRAAVRRQQLGERPEGEEPAGIDDGDAVAEALGLLHVMGRVDDGAPLAVQRLDAFEDPVARLRVHAHRGLVQQQQVGVVHHGRGEIQAALHAARIGADAIVPAIGEADEVEAPRHARRERRP